LPHAARQFLCQALGEGCEPGAREKLSDALLALGTGLPKQAAEKFDIFTHAEIGIEILAEALRHISDAPAHGGAVRGFRHIAVQNADLSRLDLPRASNDTQQ
jgi:hypothetical protein